MPRVLPKAGTVQGKLRRSFYAQRHVGNGTQRTAARPSRFSLGRLEFGQLETGSLECSVMIPVGDHLPKGYNPPTIFQFPVLSFHLLFH